MTRKSLKKTYDTFLTNKENREKEKQRKLLLKEKAEKIKKLSATETIKKINYI
jgi:hypothetical protein